MPVSAQIATSSTEVARKAPSSGLRRGAATRCGRGCGQVGHQRLELGVGTGGEGRVEALLELVRLEPPLAGGAAQRLGGALAIGVRGSHRMYCPWKPNGMWCGASARASSSKLPASSTSRKERPAAGVEHHRQHHARVLGVRAGLAHEDRLARVAAGRRPDRRGAARSRRPSRAGRASPLRCAGAVGVACSRACCGARSRSAAARPCPRRASPSSRRRPSRSIT